MFSKAELHNLMACVGAEIDVQALLEKRGVEVSLNLATLYNLKAKVKDAISKLEKAETEGK